MPRGLLCLYKFLRVVVFHYRSKHRTNSTAAADPNVLFPGLTTETVDQRDASCVDHHTNTENYENNIASLCKT